MQLSSALMLLLLGGLFVLRKLGRVMGDLYESDRVRLMLWGVGQACAEWKTMGAGVMQLQILGSGPTLPILFSPCTPESGGCDR